MKKSILFVLLLPVIIAAQNFVIPLWEDEIPNFRNSTITKIEKPADREYFYQVTKPDIAVYLPAKKNNTGQAVLVIPGGGYHKISYVWEGTDVAKWLNANGIAAIVLKYRLPNDVDNNIVRDKSPLFDASRAMKIIRANADKWNIDKSNIGVMGFSAGGHLASTLGTHYDEAKKMNTDEIDAISSRPDFLVLIYPVITMDVEFAAKGSRKNLLGENPSEELLNYYSNEKQVTSKTPSTFLVHSSNDKAVPVKNSIKFYEALQQHGVNAEMHIYQSGGHGFSLANGKGYLASWRNRCLDWLGKVISTIQ